MNQNKPVLAVKTGDVRQTRRRRSLRGIALLPPVTLVTFDRGFKDSNGPDMGNAASENSDVVVVVVVVDCTSVELLWRDSTSA